MCFYVNLPIGGIASAMLVVVQLPSPSRPNQTWTQLLWSFDPVGQVLFLGSVVGILLALQWGGTTWAWSSGRIITLMVVFSLLFIAFVANELWMGDKATIPPAIASRRTVAAASLLLFSAIIACQRRWSPSTVSQRLNKPKSP